MTSIQFEDGVSFVRRSTPVLRGSARRQHEAKVRKLKAGKRKTRASSAGQAAAKTEPNKRSRAAKR